MASRIQRYHMLQMLLNAGDALIKGEAARRCPRSHAEALIQHRIGEQRLEGVGQSARIIGRYDQSVLAVDQHLR